MAYYMINISGIDENVRGLINDHQEQINKYHVDRGNKTAPTWSIVQKNGVHCSEISLLTHLRINCDSRYAAASMLQTIISFANNNMFDPKNLEYWAAGYFAAELKEEVGKLLGLTIRRRV